MPQDGERVGLLGRGGFRVADQSITSRGTVGHVATMAIALTWVQRAIKIHPNFSNKNAGVL
jgi:hypothetical protein